LFDDGANQAFGAGGVYVTAFHVTRQRRLGHHRLLLNA
jgi:hypothetical protein